MYSEEKQSVSVCVFVRTWPAPLPTNGFLIEASSTSLPLACLLSLRACVVISLLTAVDVSIFVSKSKENNVSGSRRRSPSLPITLVRVCHGVFPFPPLSLSVHHVDKNAQVARETAVCACLSACTRLPAWPFFVRSTLTSLACAPLFPLRVSVCATGSLSSSAFVFASSSCSSFFLF